MVDGITLVAGAAGAEGSSGRAIADEMVTEMSSRFDAMRANVGRSAWAELSGYHRQLRFLRGHIDNP